MPKIDIQYTNYDDLKYIIKNNWKYFEKVFIKQDTIIPSLEFLETPRNNIAHSNVLSRKMFDDLYYHSKKIIELIDRFESK